MTNNLAAIEHAKSSMQFFELPCGYLDSDGQLHTSIEVTEMTGVEEEILASRGLNVMKKLNKILSNCSVSIGPYTDSAKIEAIVQDLTQGDRVFLLFAIRRATLGDEFPMTTVCPKCDAKARVTVDLSELEIKKMPDPMKRTYDVLLRKTNKKVSMTVLTGRGEEKIAKASAAGRDVVSHAILARMTAMDGKPAGLNDLLNLPLSDRNQLRDEWSSQEGGVDTACQLQCPQCDEEYEADVDMSSVGFFRPSDQPKDSKTKSSR